MSLRRIRDTLESVGQDPARALCVYCRGSSGARTSREHVISRAVLVAAFGSQIENVAHSEVFREGCLLDLEHVVRDVCRDCNEKLSPPDAAGARLFAELERHVDPTGHDLPWTRETLGWLIKTHANNLRAICDRETGERYELDPAIYEALRTGGPRPADKCRLFVEGIGGNAYLWDLSNPKRIPYFSYRTVRVRDAGVLISDVRLKWLDTFLLVDYPGESGDLQERFDRAALGVARTFGFRWQPVELEPPAHGVLKVDHLIPLQRFLKTVRRISGQVPLRADVHRFAATRRVALAADTRLPRMRAEI